jgi:hypothetical protein
MAFTCFDVHHLLLQILQQGLHSTQEPWHVVLVFDRALHITQVQVNAFVHKFPNNFRTPNNLGSHEAGGRVDTMCGREIRLIHDQIEHHMGGFWG